MSIQTENRSQQVKRSWAARRAKYGPSGYPPGAKHGWRYPDAEYNRRWLERIYSMTHMDANGCRIWDGYLHPSRGYGNTSYRSKPGPVHRLVFQVLRGVKLGRWEFVCHSCDNPRCCNIEHLWVGTPKENQQDMSRKGRAGLQQATHCKNGHEFTPENVYRAPSSGRRGCIKCDRERQRLPKYVEWRRQYQRRRRAEKRAKRQEQP